MSEQLKPCCEKFAEQAALKALAGGGFAYPASSRPKGQIEHSLKDRVWNVNGCCGGGCYVITDLIFCPWCGSRLPGTDSLELPKAPPPK